ncbi:MAG TPA: DUF4900 domain-containing protein [Oceanithermus profundus]|uniref:DUF4900 domain-containing protein n=1 Tax=Oceanithermus profundus TaxID=187137 RepID=A0A7C4ZI06_9DEIN|nr:DUF4900 domain-containing protein [Oceanithermus profundus]
MNNRKGIALVTALVLMMVLVAVIAILTLDTLSEIRQNKHNLVASRARNVAEAGATYALMSMDANLFSVLQPLVDGYATSFIAAGGDPSTDYVIPQNEWDNMVTSLQDTLNSTYNHLPASDLSGVGSATITYEIKDFRIGSMSTASGAQYQTYTAEYKVVSEGSSGNGKRRIREEGYLVFKLGRASLSQWLFLVENANGQEAAWSTGNVFDGPVHANKNWGFRGHPDFKGRVTGSDGGAWFWDVGCGDGLDEQAFLDAASRPPCTVPDFQQGYNWHAPEVDLPTNSLSQTRAALGLDPAEDADHDGVPDPVTPAALCFRLGVTPCVGPSPIPDGVYLVNDGASVTGGIYVQGNLDELYLAAGGDGTQTYRLRQGANTWTIVVDYAANNTTVTRPDGTVLTLAGVPNGPAPLGSGGPTGQIYVTGSIGAVRAPARTAPVEHESPDHPPPAAIPPALSLETQLNITARGEIGILTDLIYECDPVMISDSAYISSRPRCGAVSGNLPTVLGIFSETDNIVLKPGVVDEIYLWGAYLAASPDKGLTVPGFDNGVYRGAMHLFGSIIQWEDKFRGIWDNNTQSITSGYRETFGYDRRFENSRLVPPNFPTTSAFQLQSIETRRLTYKEY